MRLLVVSQYYYPEQFRINDICKEWVKRGHQVTVLTGIPNYPQGKYYKGYNLFKNRKEVKDGVEIIRIPLVPRGNNSLTLFLNYISFVISGWFFAKFTKRKFEKVFIYEVSPMTQAFIGIWYAERRKIECNLYVMDLWPDSIELATGIKNKMILNIVGKMADKIYSKCDRIFTSSESFKDSIASRGHSIDKLLFWPQYAEEFYKPVNSNKKITPEIEDDNSFKIIFTGNIGYAQGLETCISIAEKIKEKNINAKFYLIGDGRAKQELTNKVIERKLERIIIFINKKPSNDIPKYCARCDAAFIALKKNKISERILPAKLQSYLACGLPVLGCIDGEVNKIIKKSHSGYCVAAEDVDGFIKILIKIMSLKDEDIKQLKNNALKFFNNNYEKTLLLDKIEEIMLK